MMRCDANHNAELFHWVTEFGVFQDKLEMFSHAIYTFELYYHNLTVCRGKMDVFTRNMLDLLKFTFY